jgi:probable HAF family extracellular repeat protein
VATRRSTTRSHIRLRGLSSRTVQTVRDLGRGQRSRKLLCVIFSPCARSRACARDDRIKPARNVCVYEPLAAARCLQFANLFRFSVSGVRNLLYARGMRFLLDSKRALVLALSCSFFTAFVHADAQVAYTVTDLGTLGGSASTAFGVGGQGPNAAGMIVGSSATSDNSEHAFLFVNGQMFDLNTLCDLSQGDFKVLTVAKAINDSCVIIGEGITTNGDKHAFMLTPLSVQGGQWSYRCCEWVWIEEGGGWWWEENCGCFKWHGPPGPHRPPPPPPPCWWYPLPCPPPCHRPSPTPTPPPPSLHCWCCINGQVIETTAAECREKGGQCYPTKEEALRFCSKTCWCCIDGKVVQMSPAECREKEGQCYGSREEALRYCADLCWCCIDGKVVHIPAAVCKERGGQCYTSREEALRHCSPPPACWCCINGQVIETTPQVCEQRGGQCYGSREEAFRRCAGGPTPPGRPTPTPTISTWIPGIEPTPTPTLPPPVRVTPSPPKRTSTPNGPNIRGFSTPTPTPSRHRGKPTPTPRIVGIKGEATPTPSRKRPTPSKAKKTPTPSPTPVQIR